MLVGEAAEGGAIVSPSTGLTGVTGDSWDKSPFELVGVDDGTAAAASLRLAGKAWGLADKAWGLADAVSLGMAGKA